jgi:hypothetical protein
MDLFSFLGTGAGLSPLPGRDDSRSLEVLSITAQVMACAPAQAHLSHWSETATDEQREEYKPAADQARGSRRPQGSARYG